LWWSPTGIIGEPVGPIVNLVDAQAGPAQGALLLIARNRPETTLGEIRHLQIPRHHDVRAEDIDLSRVGAVLAVAYERNLHSFADFLLTEKLGPRTLQTLAMVAEAFMAPRCDSRIPGGTHLPLAGRTDTTFPVPLKTCDESIEELRRSLVWA
jgi:uncharacterized protein